MPTFTSPFAFTNDGVNLQARKGQEVEIIEWITEADDRYDWEVLPMARVRFPDGVEISAWPDEIVGVDIPDIYS